MLGFIGPNVFEVVPHNVSAIEEDEQSSPKGRQKAGQPDAPVVALWVLLQPFLGTAMDLWKDRLADLGRGWEPNNFA